MDNAVLGLYQEQKIAASVALANITNRVLKSKIS